MEHHLTRSFTLAAQSYGLREMARRPRRLNASPFFSPGIRADMQVLYDVQAALRQIVESPHFADETRDFLIDCIEQALQGHLPEGGKEPTEFTLAALRMYHLHQNGRMDIDHPLRLVQAARRDVSRPTCASWSDLMLYCRYAAEPLGRATLQLHEVNDPAVEQATDALCAALTVLHLLRRTGPDWKQLGRCSLPLDWIAEEDGTPEQLVEARLTPTLRRVLNRTLDRTADLLAQAAPLPQLALPPRLRAESVRLLAHARFQLAQLRSKDPLRQRLHTPKWRQILFYLRGWWLAKR